MHELLNKHDMETIVFFANGARVNDLQSYNLSWRTVDQQLKDIAINDQKKIIIAYDIIEEIDDLANLVSGDSKVFILRHTKPEPDIVSSLIAQLNRKNCIIEGNYQKQHDDPEYKMIQEIDKYGVIEATKNLNELEKVFDELKRLLSGDPILEAKLELLHKCLLPSSAPLQKAFDDEFKILKNYEDRYKTFLASINGKTDVDVFNPDYIETVKQLRIALLGS